MLKIYGQDKRSSEYGAAEKLAQLARRAHPDIDVEDDIELHIFPSVQCYQQPVQDIDLLVLFADRREVAKQSGVQSFAVTIEVKRHSSDRVRFEGAKCFVGYHDRESEASQQSERQKYSVINYIKGNRENGKAPLVHNLIWLLGVPKSEIPRVQSNIFGFNSRWSDFCAKLQRHNKGRLCTFDDANELREVCQVFAQQTAPSRIDAKKLKLITAKTLDADRQQYAGKLGKQLLIFRGRAGTGKTVRLLQIAHQAYEEKALRVLVLTYNHALAMDIKRLLRMKNTVGEGVLEIRTIMSFMHGWLVYLGAIEPNTENFYRRYEELTGDLLARLESGALPVQSVRKAKREHAENIEWDLILVDESHDSLPNERDLLYKLYGYEKLIVADGVDQFARSTVRIDWCKNAPHHQIVSLRKGLRLKSSLSSVVKHFAQEIEFTDWDVELDDRVHGGKVIFVVGDALSKEFHDELRERNQAGGNAPIDTLFCVPSGWVQKNDDGTRVSKIAQQYDEWGLKFWDGVDEQTRKNHEIHLDQCRIVNYQSCRGLEGWVVFNVALDEFFEAKHRNPKIAGQTQHDLLFSKRAAALEYAKQCIMIPLTRAVDTLVVHVADENSYVGKALTNLYKRYPDAIEWRRFAD